MTMGIVVVACLAAKLAGARHRSAGCWFYALETLTVLGGLAEFEREPEQRAGTAYGTSAGSWKTPDSPRRYRREVWSPSRTCADWRADRICTTVPKQFQGIVIAFLTCW
jgi:hypothetical protein